MELPEVARGHRSKVVLVLNQPLPRGMCEGLILPLFLWAGPGSASPANFHLPRQFLARPGSHWRHLMERKGRGFGSPTGLVSVSSSAADSLCWPSQLTTQGLKSTQRSSAALLCSGYLVLTVCLTIIENAGDSGRYFSKYLLQNAISLYPPHPHLKKNNRKLSD